MTTHTSIAGMNVLTPLYQFIEHDVLVGLDLNSDEFWQGFANLINELTPENKHLLEIREQLQQQINKWHQNNFGKNFNFNSYKQFLTDIGYLAPQLEDFSISTNQVDAEIATMAGPQLVVPITNARFALNAVNARWGSLYDALYGSDIISENGGAEKAGQYNPVRGQQVIEYSRKFLDISLPLQQGSHQQAIEYKIVNDQLEITLANDQTSHLANTKQWLGFTGTKEKIQSLLFEHNGLKLEIHFNKSSEIGKRDLASISDISLEAALTTIMDCEDSVSTVDGQDKLHAYQNWLGLIKGELTEQISKGGKTFTREMAKPRNYTTPNGQLFNTSGRSLMFIRNVGHLMTNDAILTTQNQPVFEGILDAVITSLIACFDVNKLNQQQNSQHGSIYIVKPKMHGPDEVAFTNTLFTRVEQLLKLPKNTIKMGIMDEERRTSVNLKACIYQAKERVVFINTGFLDRTGDEIHTSMAAGAMQPKADIKQTPWLPAYENNNVDVGLACGFNGKAQIGKGMWPVPDNMAQMMDSKIDHVKSGANTAWIPSPTAATLHALHYHQVNVFEERNKISARTNANIDEILTIPLAENTVWSEQQISDEIDNNVQGILGYIVRWIDQGVGCSKVPDISNVGLMEDRATLRISSQHIANWLKHNICSKEQVEASLRKMAVVVDQQNCQDPLYQPLSANFDDSLVIQAAYDLLYKGEQQPNGYTEPVLHYYRARRKLQN